MIPVHFAAALVMGVLSGLIDKIRSPAPVVHSSWIPTTSIGFAAFSGTLYYLYSRLVKKQRIDVTYTSPSCRRKRRILDGRLHRQSSQSSAALPHRFHSRRPRNRCRQNLLQATKDSLEVLHHNWSSDTTNSLSSSAMKLTENINDKTENSNSDGSNYSEDSGSEDGRRIALRRRKRFGNKRKTRGGMI